MENQNTNNSEKRGWKQKIHKAKEWLVQHKTEIIIGTAVVVIGIVVWKNKENIIESLRKFKPLFKYTDDELKLEREIIRERYVETDDIYEANRLYHVLHRFDAEMIDRANIKYENEHPDAQPRHREHGWYLSNDD